jgi:hypothetical protein
VSIVAKPILPRIRGEDASGDWDIVSKGVRGTRLLESNSRSPRAYAMKRGSAFTTYKVDCKSRAVRYFLACPKSELPEY